MAGRLDGKVAIITGAAGGIGSRLVRAFLREGARVTAADVSGAALASLAAGLAGDGATRERLMTIETDVSDARACASCVESTVDHFGTVHALVNNAGISLNAVRPDYLTRPVRTSELSPEIWDRFVGVNLSGAWYLSYHVLPRMVEQGYGRIINVTTSFAGTLAVGMQPYGPTKSGLESMTASHAGEFRGTGVTVNVVVPGGAGGHPDDPGRGAVRAPSTRPRPPARHRPRGPSSPATTSRPGQGRARRFSRLPNKLPYRRSLEICI